MRMSEQTEWVCAKDFYLRASIVVTMRILGTSCCSEGAASICIKNLRIPSV